MEPSITISISQELKVLAKRLEDGNIPTNGEMVAKLIDIARRVMFLEGIVERHVKK